MYREEAAAEFGDEEGILSPAITDPLSLSTTFSSSPSDLCFEVESLQDLASRGQWRSVVDKVARARSLSLISRPHEHLVYLAFNVLSLFKLRRFSDALRDLESILADPPPSSSSDDAVVDLDDPFDSPRFRYESYPDVYAGRSGSMLPFALRYLHAELPQRLGDRATTIDRLYSLLGLARRRISAGGGDQWRRREVFLMSAVACNHFSHREFGTALSLIRSLLASDPSDPVLLSKLAYVQLQAGDLDGARASFSRVEELGGNGGRGIEFGNLVARNRALEFLVAKDYVSAVREYEGCIERDPTDVVAVNNKALCLMYSRDLSDSIKVLEGALELVPTAAVNETLVVNLCSMYELAYVHHGDSKKSLSNWIAKVAPDDFDSSCTRI